jgi:pimeloyl-ACP methyl ester carboxylesterase
MTPLLLLACAAPEPLDLPADPAARGVPVGVTTWTLEETTAEVWYPAADAEAASPTESPDFSAFVPASVSEVLGEVALPTLDSGAVRDAALRPPEAPYPVVLFSHGFGAFRVQSLDVVVHLASRGYVVVAPDHPGRMLGDLLPCLFSPVLEGCDLTAMVGADPGPEHLEAALERLEQEAAEGGFFEGAVDLSRLGVTGHSAGASSAAALGGEDERFSAVMPMSTSAAPAREVPTLLMSGTCDAVIPPEATREAFAGVSDGHLLEIAGAGHQAFSDICALDLPALAQELLVGRDDVNDTLLDSLELLAADGCPGYTPAAEGCEDFLDLETTQTIVRYYGTVFFDEALYGSGAGVAGGIWAEALVE